MQDTSTDPIAFTGHELVFILGLSDGVAAAASRDALGLVGGDDASDPALYGMTTLLARGFGHLDGADLEVDGPARHVAVALLEASEWMRVAVLSDEATGVYVVAKAGTACIALQARELGIYSVTPMDPATDLRSFAAAVSQDLMAGLSGEISCSAQGWTLDRAQWAVSALSIDGEHRTAIENVGDTVTGTCVTNAEAVAAFLSALGDEERSAE